MLKRNLERGGQRLGGEVIGRWPQASGADQDATAACCFQPMQRISQPVRGALTAAQDPLGRRTLCETG